MFWRKTQITGRPTSVPACVGVVVVAEMQKLPHTSDHWVKMRAVMRPKPGATETTYEIRIFDEWETEQRNLKVTDYATFDSYPDLVQYEGWFDKKSKKVQIKALRTA